MKKRIFGKKAAFLLALWSLLGSCEGGLTETGKNEPPPPEDTTEYTPEYVITYDPNGAEGAAPEAYRTEVQGKSVTVAGQGGMERTRYAFTGWNTAPDGSGTAVKAGSQYKLEESVTFYAQWQRLGPYINLQEDMDIAAQSFSFEQGAEGPLTFSVEGTASSYYWFLNGFSVIEGRINTGTTHSLTLATQYWTAGVYELIAAENDGSNPWTSNNRSARCLITVTAKQ